MKSALFHASLTHSYDCMVLHKVHLRITKQNLTKILYFIISVKQFNKIILFFFVGKVIY